jgi:hypothetical protein
VGRREFGEAFAADDARINSRINLSDSERPSDTFNPDETTEPDLND